ncbi:MAG: SIMPL domain-containing protein [Chloroflexota bacterium]|nr:SIMPL domain-containing protein [Chloroflexota bacterium]
MLARLLPVVGLAALTAGLLAVAPLSAAQPAPTAPTLETGVSVVGSGIVLATPTLARVTLGVEVFDASLSTGQAEASRRMDAVIDRLRAAGIADPDIRTVAFNIIPLYDQREQAQSILRGYQVQNLVEVRTTSIGSLGRLLDDAVAAGASRVHGIRFEADNMEALRSQARDQAMLNARAKAEQLARNAGVALGRPVRIEEADTSGVTPVRESAPAALAAPAQPTPIQPGELQIQTNVHVVWAIQ